MTETLEMHSDLSSELTKEEKKQIRDSLRLLHNKGGSGTTFINISSIRDGDDNKLAFNVSFSKFTVENEELAEAQASIDAYRIVKAYRQKKLKEKKPQERTS